MEHFDVIKRIKELCKSKDISFYRLSKDSGIPQSTLTNTLNRGTVPSIFTLEKICNALDITLAQFFSTSESLHTNTQHQLLELYNSLSAHDQALLFAYLKGLCHK